MSITEQYNPDKNAVVESVKRTLKYEYALKKRLKILS